jgi:hypothetical protein
MIQEAGMEIDPKKFRRDATTIEAEVSGEDFGEEAYKAWAEIPKPDGENRKADRENINEKVGSDGKDPKIDIEVTVILSRRLAVNVWVDTYADLGARDLHVESLNGDDKFTAKEAFKIIDK